MNILLVDDEPHYLMLLGDFLRNQGWTVLTAENGEEALESLRQHPVEIVISDIYMPILNGIDFQKAMRQLPGYEKTPFIFVSAYADSSTLATLDLSDDVKFLSKSVSPAKLKEWMNYLITPPGKRGKHPGEETSSGSAAQSTRTGSHNFRESRTPKRR